MEKNILVTQQREEGKVFSVLYHVSAPWAHPMWQNYLLSLADLTTVLKGKPSAKLLKEGMTHEFLLFAFNPEHNHLFPYKFELEKWGSYVLWPPNYGYQFNVESDQKAMERISAIIQSIEDKKLSPDTDFRRVWDDLFKDGVTLLKRSDPHEVSKVKCDLCGKEWVAVRPEGLTILECPNCGNMVQFENIL